MNPHEWLAIFLILAALLAAFWLIRTLTNRLNLSPERARKSVHVFMGLLCCSFPWIFESPLPVWILAALATLFLLSLRLIPFLKNDLGRVLHRINRPSCGEVIFAPAVATVFQLSRGNEILFLIPILILTLADAAGALTGTRWGKRHYICGDSTKSFEGSLGFLLVAFACILAPLTIGQVTDFPQAFWIAVILATLAMMAEGFSDRGFDNMILPVGCFFVLERLLPLDSPALLTRFIVLAALLALVLAGSHRSTLNGGALLGAAMLGYGCAILADWRYAIPPGLVFVYRLITHDPQKPLRHRLDAVISHAIPCLAWVLASASNLISPTIGLIGISLSMAIQLVLIEVKTPAWLLAQGQSTTQLWMIRGCLSLLASLPILLFR